MPVSINMYGGVLLTGYTPYAYVVRLKYAAGVTTEIRRGSWLEAQQFGVRLV